VISRIEYDMNRAAEFDKWMAAEYPYDRAECGCSAIEHANHCCGRLEHAEMIEAAGELGLFNVTLRNDPEKFHNTVLAFRKRFAKFYKKENSDE
jgi:hypothetical protein